MTKYSRDCAFSKERKRIKIRLALSEVFLQQVLPEPTTILIHKQHFYFPEFKGK